MQNFLALAIVAIAAGYLGWRAWRTLAVRKNSGCGAACGSCSTGDDAAVPKQKPLVTIAPLKTGQPIGSRD